MPDPASQANELRRLEQKRLRTGLSPEEEARRVSLSAEAPKAKPRGFDVKAAAEAVRALVESEPAAPAVIPVRAAPGSSSPKAAFASEKPACTREAPATEPFSPGSAVRGARYSGESLPADRSGPLVFGEPAPFAADAAGDGNLDQPSVVEEATVEEPAPDPGAAAAAPVYDAAAYGLDPNDPAAAAWAAWYAAQGWDPATAYAYAQQMNAEGDLAAAGDPSLAGGEVVGLAVAEPGAAAEEAEDAAVEPGVGGEELLGSPVAGLGAAAEEAEDAAVELSVAGEELLGSPVAELGAAAEVEEAAVELSVAGGELLGSPVAELGAAAEEAEDAAATEPSVLPGDSAPVSSAESDNASEASMGHPAHEPRAAEEAEAPGVAGQGLPERDLAAEVAVVSAAFLGGGSTAADPPAALSEAALDEGTVLSGEPLPGAPADPAGDADMLPAPELSEDVRDLPPLELEALDEPGGEVTPAGRGQEFVIDLGPAFETAGAADPDVAQAGDWQGRSFHRDDEPVDMAALDAEPLTQPHEASSEVERTAMWALVGAPRREGAAPEALSPLAGGDRLAISDEGARAEGSPELPDPETLEVADADILEVADDVTGLSGASEEEVPLAAVVSPPPAPAAAVMCPPPAPAAAVVSPPPAPAATVVPPPPPPPVAVVSPPPPPREAALPEPEPDTTTDTWGEQAEPERPLLRSSHVPGMHRVVVHTADGQVKRGTVTDVDLESDALLLSAQGGQAERVPVGEVKAVFFMLPPGAQPAEPEGKRVRVTFRDGRQVAGFSADYAPEHPGFFVVPCDTRTHTQRIWVYRSAVRQVSVS
jgi:hypothetical protein